MKNNSLTIATMLVLSPVLMMVGIMSSTNVSVYGQEETTSQTVELVKHKIKEGKKFMWDKLIGQVKNTSDESIASVEIVATFYDEDGDIFDTRTTYTSPSEISPQTKAPFTMLLDNDFADDVETYDLSISWRDPDNFMDTETIVFEGIG